MKQLLNHSVFGLMVLIGLASALVEIIFVVSGVMINQYFIDIVKILMTIACVRTLILLILFAVAKFKHYQLYHVRTFYLTTLLSVLSLCLIILI